MTTSTVDPAGRLTLFLVSMATAAAIASAAAAQPAEGLNILTATRVVGDQNRTRFIADLTDGVEIDVFSLADPYRIVIDLPEIHFQLEPGTGANGFALISAYRFGLISRGQSRIVLDVTEPVEVADYFVIPAVEGQPARLVIDLVTTSREAFLAAALDYRQSGGATPAPRLTNNADDGRLMIVIDPGHGGIDPGAIGAANVREKDIVLAFSQELAEQLQATGHYEVALTHDDDSYLTLTDRVEFARSLGADIFLSIHADSFSVASVRGAAVYTVSERASNQMVAAIAARENQSDILAGMNIHNATNEVADILIDLARRETKNFSVLLARDIIEHLGATTLLSNNPHQKAGFVVLMAPDVPSVLIELGFLSNAQDVQTLQTEVWRRQTAASIVGAIDAFFATRIADNMVP